MALNTGREDDAGACVASVSATRMTAFVSAVASFSTQRVQAANTFQFGIGANAEVD